MPRYRVAMRVLDLLVTEGEALLSLARLCAMEEESTVKVEAVAEVL
jgi:hypothetical protein